MTYFEERDDNLTPEKAVERLKALIYTAEKVHFDFIASLTLGEAKAVLSLAEKGLEHAD